MKTSKINNDVQSSYKAQRSLKAFRLGAVAGGSISIANSIFHHKDISDSFLSLAAKTSKNKALIKTGTRIAAEIGLAAVVYGLINTTISNVIDFFAQRAARNN